jgi:hypothetical protein
VADQLDQYDETFRAAGQEWNVDWRALKAIAAQESRGDPGAMSKAGARGLMQIMPDTGKKLGMTDLHDPVQSIWAGAKYMNEALTAERDNPHAALLYYHGGPGWRQAYGPESKGYVPAVAGHYQRYAKAETGTATDATPAPAEGKVAQKKPDDDAFTRAMNAPASEQQAPATPAKAAEPDAFTRALQEPGKERTSETKTPAAPAAGPPVFVDEFGNRSDGSAMPEPGPNLSTVAGWRKMLEPEPGWVPSGILPIETKEVSPGQGAASAGIRWSSMAPFRSVAEPVLNALEGTGLATSVGGPNAPLAGTVSPDVTMMLLGGKLNRPVQQWRNPLAAPGRDVQFGPATPAEAGPVWQPPAPTPPPPIELGHLTDVVRRSGPEQWRTVEPGEAPEPGRSYRMNQQTGTREVLEAGSPEATPPAGGAGEVATTTTEHTPWVGNTTTEIQRVVQENAEAGGPASLGAAVTPQELAQMSPAQVKAHRRMSELRQIVTPIEGEDATEWVRGSNPTRAERLGQPTESQKEIMTRQKNPDAFEGENGQLTINDRSRVRAVDETVLSDTQAADLKERQQKAASEAQGRILSTAKPVDYTEAAAWIDAKLADPLIQEDKYVFNSLKGLRDQLYDAEGNLKTDPRGAWGMHNNLRNKLLDAKDPLSANPSEKYAVTQVNEFKKLVDGALDKASDGQFRTHLDEQAEFLKSLNAWKLLNDFRYGPNKMINAKTGMINANAFHRFVTDLAIRRGRPGIDAAMDIPDEVMQRLINVDQDLKRAGRIDLGKPRGSSTNLFFELAGALGIAGVHAATAAATAGTPFGGIANVGVQTGISSIQNRMGRRRLNRLTREALEPPVGGLTQPPGNALQPSP